MEDWLIFVAILPFENKLRDDTLSLCWLLVVGFGVAMASITSILIGLTVGVGTLCVAIDVVSHFLCNQAK